VAAGIAIASTMTAILTALDGRRAQACETAAAIHNELGITEPLDTRTRRYFDRPYHVLDAGRFTTAVRDAITDPQIQQLPATGAVDQHIDSTDALGNTGFLRAAIIVASQPASA